MKENKEKFNEISYIDNKDDVNKINEIKIDNKKITYTKDKPLSIPSTKSKNSLANIL